MNDPRAEQTMRRYMALLNEITSLGALGFAELLDTASPDEMSRLIVAADTITEQIARAKTIGAAR